MASKKGKKPKQKQQTTANQPPKNSGKSPKNTGNKKRR